MQPFDRLQDHHIKAMMGGDFHLNEIDIEVVSEIVYTPEEPRTHDHSGWPPVVECLTCPERIAWDEANKICSKIEDYGIRRRIFPLLADAIADKYQYWIDHSMYDEVEELRKKEATGER